MGFRAKIAGLALALVAAAGAHAQQMQIQFAEKVNIAASAGHTEFDAYGRRFSLELESNDRALARLPAQRKASLDDYHLWRGALAGQQGSWTRLVERAGRIEGAIWDGRDMYVVTGYARIAPYLANPIAARTGDTVVYRLSDARNLLPAKYCATQNSADGLATNNGLVQYRKLIGELSANAAQAIATMTQQIEISLIGDSALQGRVTDPTFEMLAGFSITDGIYAEQLGLLILPTDVRVIPAAGDPFTSTNPSTLLGQLSTYRQGTPAVRALGIAHLLTGKDLDADTVGIARISGVCSSSDGISLAEAWHGSFTTGLVMAHELGHNFGAEHDGVSGACAAVPQDFIMAPNFNFSSTFSQCSIDAMRPVLAGASCIVPASYAKAEFADTGSQRIVENDTPLIVSYRVASTGTVASQNVVLSVTAPASFAVTGISPSNGCTGGAGNVTCTIGTLAPGSERVIAITFLPSVIASFSLDATVTGSNNQNVRGTTQHHDVIVVQNTDASIAISAAPTTVLADDNIDYTVTVSSVLSHTVNDVRFSLGTGAQRFVSAAGPGASCAVTDNSVVCSLGDMPGGTTRQVVVRSVAVNVGEPSLSGFLFAPNDTNGSNNNAFATVRIDPRRDVGVAEVTHNITSPFGEAFEFSAALQSYGVDPVEGVSLTLTIATPFSTNDGIDSVTIGGVACTPQPRNFYQCAIGTMSAGENRPIIIRGRGLGLGTYGFNFRVTATRQDNSLNDELSRGVTIMYPVDVQLFSGAPTQAVESLEFQGNVDLESEGFQAVASSVIDVVMPAQISFVRFFIDRGSCTIVDAQHLRCTTSFAGAGARASISFIARSDTPGSYTARATVTTPGDAVVANDSRDLPITVAGVVDAGVQDYTVPKYVVVGRDYPVPLTIFTGSRDVPGVTIAVQVGSAAQIRSLTSARGTCTRMTPGRFECDLGTVPGGSTVAMIATIAASSQLGLSAMDVSVFATGENNQANNYRSVSFSTIEPGDIQVSVAATSVTTTEGLALTFPTIEIRRVGPVAEPQLEITLPTTMTLASMSGAAIICSGTTVLQCQLPSSWPEAQALTIGLVLNAPTVGTSTGTLRVSSGNDSTPANNEASVAITVNAATPPPVVTPPSNPPPSPPASGGGGGGGSIELPSAILLALLLMRRQRQRFARRPFI